MDKLTPKQKAFADNYIDALRRTNICYKENSNRSEKDETAIRELRKIIDFDNLIIFNTWRYKHVIDPEILIIDAYLTICHEKTTKLQKEAAYEILKYLVSPKYLDSWIEGNAEEHKGELPYTMMKSKVTKRKGVLSG